MVCFKIVDALTTLAPDRNDHLSRIHCSFQGIMSLDFLTIAFSITILVKSVPVEVAECSGVFSLIFSAAIAAPHLQSINTAIAASELCNCFNGLAF